MNKFDGTKHPRGHANNAGSFSEKQNSSPESVFSTSDAVKTPEQVAAEIYRGLSDFPYAGPGHEIRAVLVKAIQADRAQRIPDERYEAARDALARYDKIEYWGTTNAPADIARIEVASALRAFIQAPATV